MLDIQLLFAPFLKQRRYSFTCFAPLHCRSSDVFTAGNNNNFEPVKSGLLLRSRMDWNNNNDLSCQRAFVLTYSPRLFHQFVFLFSSNVIDNYTGLPLANGKTTHVTKVGGRIIGFVGLVEDAWIQTLATVDEEQVTYKGTSIFILFPMSVTN